MAKRALVIANSLYDDGYFTALPAAAADAVALAGVLADPAIGGFIVEQMVDVGQRDVTRAIESFFYGGKPEDLLLMHLSLHGWKDLRNRLHFVTRDTEREFLHATGVSAVFVSDCMSQSRSGRIVVLLDCCYSGAFTTGMLRRSAESPRVDIAEPFAGKGRVVMTASTSLQFAHEDQPDVRVSRARTQPSLFTSAVVQGMSDGSADLDHDGRISVGELYEYVRDQVRRKVPGQTPTLSVDSAQGTIYLARSPRSISEGDLGASGHIRPFVFEKAAYRERKALARAFARSWEQAVRRCFAVKGITYETSSTWLGLRSWLEQVSDEAGDVESLYELIDDHLLAQANPPDVKLLALIQWLDPSLPAVYRGQWLTRDSLSALAAKVATDYDPKSESARVISDLHRLRLLPRLARMSGSADFGELDHAWRELDGGFRKQALILAQHLPTEAQQVLANDIDVRRQAALLCLVFGSADLIRKLGVDVANAARSLPAPVPWYDSVSEDIGGSGNELDYVILIALSAMVVREAAAAAQAQEERAAVSRLSRERWEERERQRLDGSPGPTRSLVYSATVAGITLPFVVLINFISRNRVIDVVSITTFLATTALVTSSEVFLAKRLGSDYVSFNPLTRSRAALRRVSGHGAGAGCLLIIIAAIFVPIALELIAIVPYIACLVLAGVHMSFWRRRRAEWLRMHEQECQEVLGIS